MQSITTLAVSLTTEHLKLALIFILGLITILSVNDIRGQRSNVVSQTFAQFTKPAKDEQEQEQHPFQIVALKKKEVKSSQNNEEEYQRQISLQSFLQNKYQNQVVLSTHNFLDYNNFIRIQHQIEQQPICEINQIDNPSGQPIDEQPKTQHNLFDSPKEARGQTKLGRLLSPTAIHRRMKKPMKKSRKCILDLKEEIIESRKSEKKEKKQKRKSIRKVDEETGRKKRNFFAWMKKINFLKRIRRVV